MAITDLALSFTPIPGGAFAGGYASFQNGGSREAATAVARNAIPDYLRNAGMTCWQQDTLADWRLNPGPWVHTDADWTPIGSGGSAAGPSGAVQFSDGAGNFLADDPSLHFSNATNRLGVGTNTPAVTFHVVGDYTLDGTNGILNASNNVNITAANALTILCTGGTLTIQDNSDPINITGSERIVVTADAFIELTSTTDQLRLNATAGSMVINTPSILPVTDNATSLGDATHRWLVVRAVTVTTGDLEMISEERDAHWVIQEEHDRIVYHNKKTGKKFAAALIPLED